MNKIQKLMRKYLKEDFHIEPTTGTEILRQAIIAELEAINLYEHFVSISDNQEIKTILLNVAKEEKIHIGEFQSLLLKYDPTQDAELDVGKKEVEDA